MYVCVWGREREREREREINPSSVFKEQLTVIMWITSTITRKTTDDGSLRFLEGFLYFLRVSIILSVFHELTCLSFMTYVWRMCHFTDEASKAHKGKYCPKTKGG